MAIAPPAWELHPCLILVFTAHPGVDGEKGCHYSCHVKHCSTIDAPSTHKTTTTTPGFSGARYYPFLVDPLSHVPTRPRVPSVNRGTMPVRQPQGITCSPQDPGPFTVPSSMSARYPRYGRPLPGHVATAPTKPSPLRHRLRVLWTPRPSLDSIKERAEGSSDRGQ
jgi:hypothetical protein